MFLRTAAFCRNSVITLRRKLAFASSKCLELGKIKVPVHLYLLYSDVMPGLLDAPPVHKLPPPIVHKPYWDAVAAAISGQVDMHLDAHTRAHSGTAAPVEVLRTDGVTDADLEALERFEAQGGDVRELGGGRIAPAPASAPAHAAAGAMHVTTDGGCRLHHGHGHTVSEMFSLRHGRLGRQPDVVVFPTSHEDVEALVTLANEYAQHVALIPFGGGTSVSGALECPENEHRSIVVVSMRKLNRIVWVDRESMQACVQAGIIGTDLERVLKEQGLTMGHEPDSYEFSSLGGWVATRASGMKKNTYGNIEDIIIGCRCVTPTGVMESASLVPRQSVGPDPLQLVLGSEGTLGIITDVVVKVKPLPTARAYGSVVFPSFTAGVSFMRELAAKQAQPASVRLVDNEQFQFGQALKAKPHNPLMTAVKDTLQKAYVTRVAGFEPTSMVAATLLFEGTADTVAVQQRRVYAIAKGHGGMAGGEANGIRGYFLTYMIAYVRDFAMKYWFLAESFETSVPWSNVLALCDATKGTVRAEARAQGVQGPIYVSCRVTQTYDTGAVVYFYFGFMHKGLADPLATFHAVEAASRRTILAHGGSLSHHHGVGKHRAGYLKNILTPASAAAVRGAKFAVDPRNVMAAGNGLFSDDSADLKRDAGAAAPVHRAAAAYAPFEAEQPGAAAAALAAAVHAGIAEKGAHMQAKL